jgi:hypothetical protein
MFSDLSLVGEPVTSPKFHMPMSRGFLFTSNLRISLSSSLVLLDQYKISFRL